MRKKKINRRKEQESFLRILDANYNRAKEALRVSEDLVRFLMNDRVLTSQFKTSRHQLTQTLLRFPVSYSRFLSARDSVSDVGKKGWIADRPGKSKWQDLLCSNIKRAEEALRVLEEISKAIRPKKRLLFRNCGFGSQKSQCRTTP